MIYALSDEGYAENLECIQLMVEDHNKCSPLWWSNSFTLLHAISVGAASKGQIPVTPRCWHV